MGYSDGTKEIMDIVAKNGRIIELDRNKTNLKANYKEIKVFSNGKKLAIRYPGYKTTGAKCDYCVYLVDGVIENPISHVEIMTDLYNKTTEQNYHLMKKYLETVAQYGLDKESYTELQSSDISGFSFEELTALMFYIAIQEDINYPEKRYQGRKMCFYRYLEAIYCKVNDNHRLEEAINRATTYGRIPYNWEDVGDLYVLVSEIQR